ncbi:oleosin-B6-like isoform X2 [Mustela putorius furo]|uniref:Oleosin-B6-like isoform X2 n=1 Tax=Mustela putorius furo TaxID=9669 RepID=A0A8U0USD8_MUSPF|nr:oleosin-B6-like isoform X2 [Mustela putorius furo]
MVGLIKQGPSCRRAGERTGNTTPNALSRTPAPPARVAAPQACALTRPGARPGPPPARGASGTFASPSPPHRPQTRARAPPVSLSSAPPNLAPPLRPSLLATLNSREQTNSLRRVTPLPLCPGNFFRTLPVINQRWRWEEWDTLMKIFL